VTEGGNLSPRIGPTFTPLYRLCRHLPRKGDWRYRTSLHRHPGLEPGSSSACVGRRGRLSGAYAMEIVFRLADARLLDAGSGVGIFTNCSCCSKRLNTSPTMVRPPQSKRIVERLHSTVLKEYLRVEGRSTLLEAIDEMLKVLDDWLVAYNTKRLHQSSCFNGRPPQGFYRRPEKGCRAIAQKTERRTTYTKPKADFITYLHPRRQTPDQRRHCRVIAASVQLYPISISLVYCKQLYPRILITTSFGNIEEPIIKM
jgi:hypothetical protein